MIKKLDVDFLNENIIQSLIIFAIPVFISNVFQQLYNTTDTIIVGHVLGENSLAAIGACSSVYDLLVGFVHKDAAASFFVTFEQILQCKSLALVFSRDADEVAEFVNMIEESGSNAVITAVRAFHNPSPIKVKFDKAIKEFE